MWTGELTQLSGGQFKNIKLGRCPIIMVEIVGNNELSCPGSGAPCQMVFGRGDLKPFKSP